MLISLFFMCVFPSSIILEQNWIGVSDEFSGKVSSMFFINLAASNIDIFVPSNNIQDNLISLLMVLRIL